MGGPAKAKFARSLMSDKHGEPDMDEAQPTGGDLERMSIERADNGFTVSTHHKPKKAGEYSEPMRHVFKTADEVGAHVRNQLLGSTKA